MKYLVLGLGLFSMSGFAAGNACFRYEDKAVLLASIRSVAGHMDLSLEELCSHPRVLDIHVANTHVNNERFEAIPHFWVTLHYNEYSCQYFVRESDHVVTKSNCYNTW